MISHKIQSSAGKKIKLLFLTVAVLAIVQVLVSNRLVTLDDKMATIDKRISQLESENDNLYQKVASYSAFLAVAQKGQELGLIKNTKYLYLASYQKVAFDRR